MSDNIVPEDTSNCVVTFDKKEYAIVGDAVFAQTIEEVPSWLLNYINDYITNINGNAYTAMNQYGVILLGALEQLEIAKNTYEHYINKVITDESAYVASLITLNASIAESDASIRQLLQTYATQDFAVANAAQLLTASLNNGEIAAKIGTVETAMATQYGALAQRLEVLEAEYTDSISDLYGKAQAMEALEAYVGSNNDGSTTSLAYRVSKLNSYLTDANTGELFGGVEQNLGGYTEVTAKNAADAAVVDIYSKYSKITVGGEEYINGFGLFANYNGTTGGSSTFWAAADQFKLYDASTLDASKIQTQTVFTKDGNPIEVVTGITGGVAPFRIENGVTYIQNAVIGWGDVAGAGKPQDGATNTVARTGSGVPLNSLGNNGDTYVDTAANPKMSYVKYNGVWIQAGNVVTNTNQVTDGAGLGATATWSGVTGTGKPSDYADRTVSVINTPAVVQAINPNYSTWGTLIENLAAGSITLTRVVQNDGTLTSGTIKSNNYDTSPQGWSISYTGSAYFKGETYFGSVTANYVSSTGTMYAAKGILANGMDVAKTTYGTIHSGSNEFTLSTAIGYKLVLQSDGNLVWYSGSTPLWSSLGGTSDIRFKDVIGLTTSKGLDTVNKLKVVDYEWKKSSALYDGGKLHTGFIAQQLKNVDPRLVGNVGDVLVVNYDNVVPILVKSVQELTNKVKLLEEKING